MNNPAFAHRPINNDLEIAFGPVNLMGRFFLKALDHAARRGVTLSFISFEDLLVINEMNLPTWQKLTPAFDLNKSRLEPDRSFCLVGRNATGEIVYTHALKLFDWRNTNVKAEIESLRMFYADPDKYRGRGEAWQISGDAAAAKSGRVVYGGAIWCRPDYRKGRLSTILPRIVWSLAYVKWNYDYLVGVITEANVKGGFPRRMGYTDVDLSVTRSYPPDETGAVKQLNYALVTMTPAELIDGNFTYLLEPIPQVQGTVHAHSA